MPKFFLDFDRDGYYDPTLNSTYNKWRTPQVSSYKADTYWGIDVPQYVFNGEREYHLKGVESYLGVPHLRGITNRATNSIPTGIVYTLGVNSSLLDVPTMSHPYKKLFYQLNGSLISTNFNCNKSTDTISGGRYIYVDSYVAPNISFNYVSGTGSWDLEATLTDNLDLGNELTRWEFLISFTAGSGSSTKVYNYVVAHNNLLTLPHRKTSKDFTEPNSKDLTALQLTTDLKAAVGEYYRQYGFLVKSDTTQDIDIELCYTDRVSYRAVEVVLVKETHTVTVGTDWQTINIVTHENVTDEHNGYFLRLKHPDGNLTVKHLFYTEDSEELPLGLQSTLWGRLSTSPVPEDLTPFVLSATWKYGKQTQDELLPYEGELKIVLANDTRWFSPENNSSPYHDLIAIGMLGKLVHDDGTILFEGLLRGLEVETGTSSTLTTTLTLTHGIERLRQSFVTTANLENVKAKDVIAHILSNSSLITPTTYHALQIDISTIDDAVVYDTDAYLAPTSGEGTRVFSRFGSQWGDTTTTAEALSQLCAAENGHFLSDSSGQLIFVDRLTYVNKIDGDILDLDNVAQQADYFWGDKITNQVEIDVKHLSTNTTSGTIWRQGYLRPIQPKETQETVISLVDRYGKSINVVGDLTPNILSYENPDKEVPVTLDIKIGIKGGRNVLTITNNTDKVCYWEGNIDATYGRNFTAGNVLTYNDIDSISTLKGVYTRRIEVYDIENEFQTESIAQSYMRYRSLPYGRFSHVVIRGYDILPIGNYYRVRETQSSAEKPVYIIGVDGRLNPNFLSMEYDTEVIQDIRYFAIGDTILDKDNLCDPYRFLPDSGNGVNGDIVYFNSGSLAYKKLVGKLNKTLPPSTILEFGDKINYQGRPYTLLPKGTYTVGTSLVRDIDGYNTVTPSSMGTQVIKHRNTGDILSGTLTLDKEEPVYIEYTSPSTVIHASLSVFIEFYVGVVSDGYLSMISSTSGVASKPNLISVDGYAYEIVLPKTPFVHKSIDTYNRYIKGNNIYVALTTNKYYDSIEEAEKSDTYPLYS